MKVLGGAEKKGKMDVICKELGLACVWSSLAKAWKPNGFVETRATDQGQSRCADTLQVKGFTSQ